MYDSRGTRLQARRLAQAVAPFVLTSLLAAAGCSDNAAPTRPSLLLLTVDALPGGALRCRDAEATHATPGEPERAEDPEVLGWQPMVLARPQVCGDCGERLERGANAYAGVTGNGIGGAYVCKDCLAERH